ncbi:MAG: hypothetical protein AAB674_01855 [Patescibacteria group bacterium]
MLNKIENFFTNLQKENESIKKQWLIILTSASMLIVTVFWGFYFNATIKTIQTTEISDQETGADNFLAVVKNGTDIISKETGLKLSKMISAVQSIAGKTNSIIINKTNSDLLIKKDMEKIAPRTLP